MTSDIDAAVEVTSFGQSFSVGRHTFGMSGVNGQVVSWRIDGKDVSEDEFNQRLKKAEDA